MLKNFPILHFSDFVPVIRTCKINYSGTPLKRTPLGPKSLSIIQGCPLLRGYASHTPSNHWAWSLGSRAQLQHMDHKHTLLMDLRYHRQNLTCILDIDVKILQLANLRVLLFCGCGQLSVLRGSFAMSASTLGQRKVSVLRSSGVSAIQGFSMYSGLWRYYDPDSHKCPLYRGCLLLRGIC